MSSLLILLLFFPLVFSATVSPLSLSDFGNELTKNNPSICGAKAYNAVRTLGSSPSVFSEEELKTAEKVLKECIAELALVNPKVQRVETQLFEKMFYWFKFTVTEMYTCETKLIKDDCYRSMARMYDCDKMLGKNGCMVKAYDESCGKGMAKKMGDLMQFINAEKKDCNYSLPSFSPVKLNE